MLPAEGVVPSRHGFHPLTQRLIVHRVLLLPEGIGLRLLADMGILQTDVPAIGQRAEDVQVIVTVVQIGLLVPLLFSA